MRLRHIFLFFLAMSSVAPVRGQNLPGSSIISRTFLSPDGSGKLARRVYDNGLGDIVQEVQYYPGSSLPCVAVHHEYDSCRRRTGSWLPVASSDSTFTGGGTVAWMARSQYSDASPLTRTEYDAFLPSHPSALYKAGAQWQGSGKKVAVTYSEQVGEGMYASPSGDGYMYMLPGAKYLRTQAVDEDGCPRAEYTDFSGRLVASETSQGRTYYVYDARGDVRYVIPPILSAYILSYYGGYSDDIPDTDGMMQKYAYIYRYDKQRHCIYRKLPGCDPVYYVYDRTGACILTQDGTQRPRHEWTYTIPDRFGRPCISGVCSRMLSYTSEPLHPVCVYAEYDGTTAATGGYAVHNLDLGPQTLHSAAYYDGYSFIGHHGVPSSLAASAVPGFPYDASLGRGLQTGSATAIITGGAVTGYMYSAMYYDSRYNVSQVRTVDHLGASGATCTAYSYTGKPLSVRSWHTSSPAGTAEVSHSYTYDGAGRVASHTLSVAHGGPAASATLTYGYDSIGRLSRVTRPFTTGVDKDASYTYDLHGWTKGITTNSFREELFYADGPGTPCYSGNVSAMRWRDSSYAGKRGYKFTYDDAGRLTQARYGTGDAVSGMGAFTEGMAYDAHGNVTAITRRGRVSSGSWGVADGLTLSYDGNRLTGVADAASDYDFSGSFEYKRANGSQYIYDANGSLVADRSRGIAYITYDAHGNPGRIYFTNGSVTTYVYSAAGQKLSVEHRVAAPNTTVAFGVEPDALTLGQTVYAGSTDYLLGGSLVRKDGMTDKYLFDGGYAQATMVSPASYRFSLCYYNSDHLGNNREVVDSAGVVKQVTNYYPFGTPYTESSAVLNAGLQPYKYNGKELDRMHGLDTYDYGARQYNPVTARWDRMDPLCEKYYDVSPYAYCHNNPANRVDIDGNDDFFSNTGRFLYTKGTGANIYIQQGNSFSNLKNFDLRNRANRQMGANVVWHYAHMVGADQNYNGKKGIIGISTLHKTDKEAGVLGGTINGNIYIKFSNGYFNEELYNKYNLMGVLIHENNHKKDQQTGIFPSNKPISNSHHARIIINEMSSDNFSKCSENYQDGQMGYLGSLAELVLKTNSTDAKKIAKEANQALAKIGWEMYYKKGNAYFRKVK